MIAVFLMSSDMGDSPSEAARTASARAANPVMRLKAAIYGLSVTAGKRQPSCTGLSPHRARLSPFLKLPHTLMWARDCRGRERSHPIRYLLESCCRAEYRAKSSNWQRLRLFLNPAGHKHVSPAWIMTQQESSITPNPFGQRPITRELKKKVMCLYHCSGTFAWHCHASPPNKLNT
ncbi:protein of unknown function [Ectopseudomonas oleovorans]|nr:protein of unknown function [Pseudomonas oleovorans]